MSATVLAFFTLVNLASAQDRFPDVPDNHWVYESLLKMRAHGLLLGAPLLAPHAHLPTPTRSDLAKLTAAVVERMRNVLRASQLEDERLAQYPKGWGKRKDTAAEARLRLLKSLDEIREQWPPLIEELRQLATFFKPELAAINRGWILPEINSLNAEIYRLRVADVGQANVRFHDVPRGHWAAEATQFLKAEGILHGYHDAFFSHDGLSAPFPSIPSHAAVYEALARIKRAGLIPGHDLFLTREGFSSGPPASRMDFAMALDAAFQSVKKLEQKYADAGSTPPVSEAMNLLFAENDQIRHGSFVPPYSTRRPLTAFEWLVQLFARELREKGADPDQMCATSKALRNELFRVVPGRPYP
ncbi:S-layer protein / Peptidoglycan endo-beta-N-acetylglucosaminidase [Fimbriimonas ginsengisoli Gsoil 348]|uniref:S-layer protein / Peptidoglycan endo-beta-N-acetylglucosaminidase n=2 Tax=Fimbriimonas ginsengisoli TaxID=1005039 RepID=A0A068NLE8_FIMGI|nr:S-layer protein / Peptidoglycan endo-beta-N-acetylglucosaminidase [Fimbriimonas ginsengisoli Gsoil 348]